MENAVHVHNFCFVHVNGIIYVPEGWLASFVTAATDTAAAISSLPLRDLATLGPERIRAAGRLVAALVGEGISEAAAQVLQVVSDA